MTLVITGATGALGRLVIENLLKSVPPSRIVAVARNVEKARDLADRGIEVRYGDYDDPASLPNAFAGADKLLFVPTPLADNAMRVVQNAHVIKAARDAGVKHILYTGYAFAEHSSLPLTRVHLATEYGIQAAEIPYTFLRNSLYLHLFLDPGLLRRAIGRGELVTNAGTGKVNAVTREDLAAAAAAALIGEGHENKAYNLVAPEPWTFDDLAAVLTEVSGKKVVHRQASFAEVKADLVDAGLPEQLAEQQAGFYAGIAAGETARSSEDLVQLIGTPTSLQEAVKRALQG